MSGITCRSLPNLGKAMCLSEAGPTRGAERSAGSGVAASGPAVTVQEDEHVIESGRKERPWRVDGRKGMG